MAINESLIVSVEIETDKTVKSIKSVNNVVEDLDKNLKKLLVNDSFAKNLESAQQLVREVEKTNKAVIKNSENREKSIAWVKALNIEAKKLAKTFKNTEFALDANEKQIKKLSKSLGLSADNARLLLGHLEIANKADELGFSENEVNAATQAIAKLSADAENVGTAMQFVSEMTANYNQESKNNNKIINDQADTINKLALVLGSAGAGYFIWGKTIEDFFSVVSINVSKSINDLDQLASKRFEKTSKRITQSMQLLYKQLETFTDLDTDKISDTLTKNIKAIGKAPLDPIVLSNDILTIDIDSAKINRGFEVKNSNNIKEMIVRTYKSALTEARKELRVMSFLNELMVDQIHNVNAQRFRSPIENTVKTIFNMFEVASTRLYSEFEIPKFITAFEQATKNIDFIPDLISQSNYNRIVAFFQDTTAVITASFASTRRELIKLGGAYEKIWKNRRNLDMLNVVSDLQGIPSLFESTVITDKMNQVLKSPFDKITIPSEIFEIDDEALRADAIKKFKKVFNRFAKEVQSTNVVTDAIIGMFDDINIDKEVMSFGQKLMMSFNKVFELLKVRLSSVNIVSSLFSTSTAGAQQVDFVKQVFLNLQFQAEKLESALRNIPDLFMRIGKSINDSRLAMLDKISGSINNFINKTKQNFINFGTILKSNFAISVVTTIEVMALFGPVLEALGARLQESETMWIRWTGHLLHFAGTVSTLVVDALHKVITSVGEFTASLGDRLIKSTMNAEESFRRFETVINRFNFAIRGVNDAFGKAATGGLSKWNDVLEEMNDNTTFAREEIAKSIKLLVLEGAQLGISFEDNVKIMRAASDIAAATGDKLTDTVGKVISAFNGEATALANLGFNLTATGLSHSKLQKDIGLTLDQMNEQEILTLRVNELLRQTKVISGAAANELNTLEGSQQALNKTYNDTLVVLGRTAVVTRQYLLFKTKLLQIINDLPEPIIEFLGYLKDIAGVFLKILGELLQVSFGLLSLLTIIKLLNFALGTTLGITISLTKMFSFFATNILPLVTLLILLKEAFDELYETSSTFKNIIDSIIGSQQDFQDETENTISIINVFSSAFQVAVDVVKLSLIGLTQIIIATQIAIVELREYILFTVRRFEK
jgi:hypothetical protein